MLGGTEASQEESRFPSPNQASSKAVPMNSFGRWRGLSRPVAQFSSRFYVYFYEAHVVEYVCNAIPL